MRIYKVKTVLVVLTNPKYRYDSNKKRKTYVKGLFRKTVVIEQHKFLIVVNPHYPDSNPNRNTSYQRWKFLLLIRR